MSEHKGRESGNMGIEHLGSSGLQPCSMIVRGKIVVADPILEDGIIKNGVVCINGDRIVAVGPYEEVRRNYDSDCVVGSANHIVIPGLVNAHDHGRGISAFQLGVHDNVLEVWLLDLFEMLQLDPYLSMAFNNVLAIESGVTTIVNNYYKPERYTYVSDLQRMIKASEDTGLRTVFALSYLDKSPVKSLIQRVLPHIPVEIQADAKEMLDKRIPFSADEFFAIFDDMSSRLNRPSSCVTAVISPVSVHWCSDELLVRIKAYSDIKTCPIHTHMLETRLQRDAALCEHGKTIVEHLKEIGFLSPQLACAHCVWVSPSDIEIMASNGVSVIHNPSSNLRLSSGLAPVNAMSRAGINLALGMDSNSLNDDNDMMQEMRLAVNLQRSTSEWTGGIDSEEIFSMATRNGAKTIGLGDTIGALQPGMAADIVLLRYDEICYPFVTSSQNSLDTLVQRARPNHVDSVIINGKMVMKEGRILTIDKAALVDEIQDRLKAEDNKKKSRPKTWVKEVLPTILQYMQQQIGRPMDSVED